MKSKLNAKDIVKALKKAIVTDKPLTHKPLEKLNNVRDMRQEAIDMGAYNSEEYFGEASQNE